jgi:hypothetical protein
MRCLTTIVLCEDSDYSLKNQGVAAVVAVIASAVVKVVVAKMARSWFCRETKGATAVEIWYGR